MNCQDVSDNLSAYLDDELSKEEARHIAEHLLVCHHCRTQWEELKRASSLLRHMPEVVPPPQFRSSLREKLYSMPKPAVGSENKYGFWEKVRKVAGSSWYKVAAVAAVFGMTLGITSLWDGGNVDIVNHPEIAKNNYPSAVHQSEAPGKETKEAVGKQSNDDARDAGQRVQQTGAAAAVNQHEAAVVQNNQQYQEVPEQSGTGGSTAAGKSTSPAVLPESVNLTTVSNISKMNRTNLIATSVLIKISAADTAAAAEKILSLAPKYDGTVVNKNPLNIRVPVKNYSSVLAELGSIDEGLVAKSSQQDFNAEYDALVKDLRQKQQREAELVQEIEKENDSAQLEKELAAVRNDIQELTAKMKLIENNAGYVDIKVEFVSAD
ncbi:anti-sigma factor RsiW [Desulfohalotomaculum tongense]|uniref:DUF4349 domain-containing protein n=1 Tax=Desulforadius tongensis TaxID=1216062 RepID=UPI001956FF81|nr:DUF4349 domain-containing protein [Desulforadius tongensis]MBM7855819.1 anti-sigma factor RsiW [Desulforadius tongensis]